MRRLRDIGYILLLAIGFSTMVGNLLGIPLLSAAGVFFGAAPEPTPAFAAVNGVEHYLLDIRQVFKGSDGKELVLPLDYNLETPEPSMQNWVFGIAVNFGMHYRERSYSDLPERTLLYRTCRNGTSTSTLTLEEVGVSAPRKWKWELDCAR